MNRKFPNVILKSNLSCATIATIIEKKINLIYGILVFKEYHAKSEIVEDIKHIAQNTNKNFIKILFKQQKLFFLNKKIIARIVIVKSGKKGPVIKKVGTIKTKQYGMLLKNFGIN